MKKKDEKILEFQYTIEALENEIETLEETARLDHERLWSIIQENDRLTLTYEPYRPPGDEHEGVQFYDLVEENEELHAQIKSLQDRNNRLTSELIDVRTAVAEMKQAKEKKKRYPKAGVISFDFWPPRDWFRLKYYKWNPGESAQLCIGPIRIDWFQS